MADLLKLSRAHMKSIVGWFGCYDAVAATINARWGGGSRACGQLPRPTGARPIWQLAKPFAHSDAGYRQGKLLPSGAKWAASLRDFAKIAQTCVIWS